MSCVPSDAAGTPEKPLDRRLDWIPATACLLSADRHIAWRREELERRVRQLAGNLQSQLPRGAVVGSLADNSPHWLIADLALHAAGMIHVPLPAFFTKEQIAHVMRASAMAALICADADLAARLGFAATAITDTPLACYFKGRDAAPAPMSRRHDAVAKITFTSGTTDAPKGVLLTFEQQMATARSLAAATAALRIERHLCLLPLPVLLENVAGAYTALLTGAECICPSLAEVGMQGASGFDARRCLDLVARQRADSLILLPQMLRGLVEVLETDAARRSALPALKFVAVGGARTSPALIEHARRLGLPVYEGYGLTECASVVSVNLPHADRLGSVGRALPGVQLRLANDGEIQVRGRGYAGYLGADAPAPDAWFTTGDLGTMDEAGYLHIVCRKKSVLVTSFVRNVSPEWPEGLITEHPGIVQAAVFGDARPFLVAVVCAIAPLSDAEIDAHIEHVNTRLPDYARLGGWIRAREPFTPANGLATGNGRARRDAVYARYAADIEARYGATPTDRLPQPFTAATT